MNKFLYSELLTTMVSVYIIWLLINLIENKAINKRIHGQLDEQDKMLAKYKTEPEPEMHVVK